MRHIPWLLGCVLVATSLAHAGERYAFIVAVKEYDPAELNPLRYTEEDASELASVLKDVGYLDSNIVLMNQSLGARRARFLPVAANIRKEMHLLFSELTPADSVLVAFAGHGVQFKGERDAFFCPADAKLTDRSTLVSLGDVYKLLADCKAETKLLFVDACRNEPVSTRNRAAKEIELEPTGIPERVAPPGGITAFFSCSSGQKAWEDPVLKHGVFFHFLVKGLRGEADLDQDRDVSLAEIEQYTVKGVQRYVRMELGQSQTPERRGEARGLVSLAKINEKVRRPVYEQVLNGAAGIKLAFIPAGDFLMGSVETPQTIATAFSEKVELFGDEHPRHRVRITKPFYLGMYEVTVGQFRQFVQKAKYVTEAEKVSKGGDIFDPSSGAFKNQAADAGRTWHTPGLIQPGDKEQHPVVMVSWNDAVAFCNWLSRQDGKRYRLPTEAEWEYACRAGTTTRFWSGDSVDSLALAANVPDLSAKEHWQNVVRKPLTYASLNSRDGFANTAPVGSFRPNPFGLYDIHGNVWEWCADGYDKDYYAQRVEFDPQGPGDKTLRVMRGGCYI